MDSKKLWATGAETSRNDTSLLAHFCRHVPPTTESLLLSSGSVTRYSVRHQGQARRTTRSESACLATTSRELIKLVQERANTSCGCKLQVATGCRSCIYNGWDGVVPYIIYTNIERFPGAQYGTSSRRGLWSPQKSASLQEIKEPRKPTE